MRKVVNCSYCQQEYVKVDDVPLCHSCYCKILDEKALDCDFSRASLFNVVQTIIRGKL